MSRGWVKSLLRNPIRATAYGLMLCAGLMYVMAALTYLTSDFADYVSPSRDPDDLAGAIVTLLQVSLGAYAVIGVAAISLSVASNDRRILRTFCLVLSWIAALAPIVVTMWVFGSWWFVKPHLIDWPGSVGFVVVCVSAVLLVLSIAALTVAEFRERSDNQYPTLGGVYATAALSGLVVAVVVLASVRPLGAVDVVELGDSMEMGPPASALDVNRIRDVSGIYDGATVLTAAGVLVVKGGVLRAYDTFGGPERWRISKPGMSVIVEDVDNYEDGSVVVVEWDPVGRGGLTEAYSADTGKILWDSSRTKSEERPGMNYLDARTGTTAWTLGAEKVCGPGRLIRDVSFSGVIPFTCEDENGIVNRIGGIDLASGVVRWSQESPRRIRDIGPVVSVSDRDTVTSYELSSGRLLGSSPRNRSGVRNEFVLTNGWQINTIEDDSDNVSFRGIDVAGAERWVVDHSWVGSVDYMTSVGDTAFFMAFADGSAWVMGVDVRTGAMKPLAGPGVTPDGQVPPVVVAEMGDRELIYDFDTGAGTLVSGGLLLDLRFNGFRAPDLWIPAA